MATRPKTDASTRPATRAAVPRRSTFKKSSVATDSASLHNPSRRTKRDDWRVKRNGFRTLGLGFLVGPIYALYWFNVTRNAVSEELGTNDNAGLQTLGLVVPILQIVILYWLCRDISKLRQRTGLPGFSAAAYVLIPWITYAIAMVALVLFLFASLTYGQTNPDPPVWAIITLFVALFFLLVAIPLMTVFWALTGKKLNEYWDAISGGRASEAEFRGGEIAVIVIGLTLIVANVIAGAIGGLSAGPAPSDPSDRPTQSSFLLNS